MITYHSTRGDKKKYTFSQAILKGIAEDGGLLIPTTIPHFTLKQLENLKGKSYTDIALFILKLWQTDISDPRLKAIVKQAYGKNFDNSLIASLVRINSSEYIVELFHGPTWAFKDLALQLMPLLFSESIQMDNKKKVLKNEKPLQYLILAATSGDTGKAALEGFKNKKNIFILVFFPDKHISSIQKLSMITQEGNNIGVYPLNGNFDNVQEIVKIIFRDKKFCEKLCSDFSISLSAANSINWGRVVPQMIYYLSSYLQLVEKKVITIGDEVDFAVPTGNFGNILAGYLAKRTGLPIRKLISASNENNVLSEFLQTGVFDASKRYLVKTPSPAMDILIPNNHERLLYFLTNDTKKVAGWMKQSKEKRKFKLDKETTEKIRELFYADFASNEDCLKCLKKTYDDTKYLMDPHTAVVKEVVNRYKNKSLSSVPIVMYSTAHWAKFPEDVYNAIIGNFKKSERNIGKDEFILLSKIKAKIPNTYLPKGLLALKKKPILHKKKLDTTKKTVEELIITFLNKKLR